MYIRNLILRNSKEFEESVLIICMGVVLGLCFVVVVHIVLSSFAIILLKKRELIALNVFL